MRLETKTTCDYTGWLWWFWFDKMHESQFSYKNLGLLVFNSNITDTIKLHLLGQLGCIRAANTLLLHGKEAWRMMIQRIIDMSAPAGARAIANTCWPVVQSSACTVQAGYRALWEHQWGASDTVVRSSNSLYRVRFDPAGVASAVSRCVIWLALIASGGRRCVN